jgi:hypothetical protein
VKFREKLAIFWPFGHFLPTFEKQKWPATLTENWVKMGKNGVKTAFFGHFWAFFGTF